MSSEWHESTHPSLLQRPATPQTYIQQYAQDQARIWDASGHRMHHLVPASHQITRHSSLAPNIHRWEYLPLNSYGGGRGQGTGGVVEFVRESRQVLLLTDAFHGTCPDLRDAERSAPLGDVSSKLSIRIPVRSLHHHRHDAPTNMTYVPVPRSRTLHQADYGAAVYRQGRTRLHEGSRPQDRGRDGQVHRTHL